MWTLHIFIVRNSSCGKVMFLQNCVKNSAQGGCTPLGRHPPPVGHCSGRYASYWNAFLLLAVIFTCGVSLVPCPLQASRSIQSLAEGVGGYSPPPPIHGTWDSMRYGRQAGDAYPTGMLFCIISFSW